MDSHLLMPEAYLFYRERKFEGRVFRPRHHDGDCMKNEDGSPSDQGILRGKLPSLGKFKSSFTIPSASY